MFINYKEKKKAFILQLPCSSKTEESLQEKKEGMLQSIV